MLNGIYICQDVTDFHPTLGLQDLLRQLSNMVGTWLFSFLGVPGVYWQNRADHANFFLLFKF